MAQTIEADMLVVGAGPVGLLAALTAARRGAKVEVYDEDFRTAAHSYALALHPRTLSLFDEFDLTSELIEQGYKVDTIAFYDGPTRCGQISLGALNHKHPYVLVLPQSLLEGMLEQQLTGAGADIHWNHRVARLMAGHTYVTATIDMMSRRACGYAVATTEWVAERTIEMTGAYVVGADGHHSLVRRALDCTYQDAGPTSSFAVFEFHTDADLAGEVRVMFVDGTTNVLWPLPGGRCRFSFQIDKVHPQAEPRSKRRLIVPIGRQAYPHVPTERLKTLMQERAPWFRGHVAQLDWSMEVRFDRRLTDSYGRDRIWLAGDAAHLTGPVGGQSLNMGLREANLLANTLTDITLEGGRPDALRTYQQRFQPEWRRLLDLDGDLTAADDAPPWAQTHAAEILPCIPATGEDLTHLAAQIGLSIE